MAKARLATTSSNLGRNARRAGSSGPLASLLVGLLALAAVPAWAAEDFFDLPLEQLETILVSAQKRVQVLQDVPISLLAISGDKIADAAIENLQMLSAYVPGVTINQAAIDNNLFIRGIGSGVNLGFERSVGTYVDGVYVGRGQLSRSPFLDVQRVEVLKGPQGILFGKNTIAGALNIVTAEPGATPEVLLAATADPEHGGLDLQAVANGALAPGLDGRLAVGWHELGGYYDHLTSAGESVATEQLLLRGKLHWQATDDLGAALKLERADFRDDGRARVVSFAGAGSDFSSQVSKQHTSSGFRPGAMEFNDTRSDTVALTIDWRWAGRQVTAITAWLDYRADIQDDVLTSDYFLAPGDGAVFTLVTEEQYQQISQELRLASPDDARLTWLLGLYAQDARLRVDRDVIWPFGGITDRHMLQESSAAAVFGQATWRLTDRLHVTAGARYNRESKDFHRRQTNTAPLPPTTTGNVGPLTLKRDETQPTWGLSAQFHPLAQVMAYVSVSTGFKGGGFDEAAGRELFPGEDPADLFEFEEETVRSWELGTRMTLLEGAAELNLALFRSTYDDLQTSAFDGSVGFVVANAASSVTQGLEADLRWRVNNRLLVNAALSLLDASFDDFPDGPCSQWHANNTNSCTGAVRDLGGESLPFAPDVAGNLGVEYRLPLGRGLAAWANLDIVYTDAFFTASDLDRIARQEAYTKYDLRLALGPEDGHWQLAVIGKNLTDERVSGWINDITLSDFPGRGNTYSALLEPPRTLMLQGRVRF